MLSKERKMEIVGVKMDDVKGIDRLRQPIQRHKMIWQRVLALRLKAQGSRARGLQRCSGLRIATGEQSDLMPLPD
jgi:hypothetical protein